ncbi:hypothetical protein HDC35_001054 [Sphingopyxis sp. JAI128]|nr:hypothetical protein [Sphingopyxis sp. JAI128]
MWFFAWSDSRCQLVAIGIDVSLSFFSCFNLSWSPSRFGGAGIHHVRPAHGGVQEQGKGKSLASADGTSLFICGGFLVGPGQKPFRAFAAGQAADGVSACRGSVRPDFRMRAVRPSSF